MLSSNIKDMPEEKPKEISAIHQKLEKLLEKLTSDINEFNKTNFSMAAELKKMSDEMKNRPAPISTSISQKPSNIEISSIFTVSIGNSATLTFTNTKSGQESELIVEDRSLYRMSRDSQNEFKHQICQNPDLSIRYSLTFRCTHWSFLNSTYAVGDSNFGHIRFGEGRGNVGAATPGLKDWSPKVDDIIPSKTKSYRNVVVMCGTNDLKHPMEMEDEEILTLYEKYKGKFEEIRKLNPKCQLFVCPVLPTRDQSINLCIVKFNKLIFSDLAKSNLKGAGGVFVKILSKLIL